MSNAANLDPIIRTTISLRNCELEVLKELAKKSGRSLSFFLVHNSLLTNHRERSGTNFSLLISGHMEIGEVITILSQFQSFEGNKIKSLDSYNRKKLTATDGDFFEITGFTKEINDITSLVNTFTEKNLSVERLSFNRLK